MNSRASTHVLDPRAALTRLLLTAAVVASTASGLGGCLFSENDQDADPAPFRLRSATPADSSQYMYDPQGRTLVVRFNRDPEPEDITSLFFLPAPLSFRGPDYSTSPEIIFHDVVFDSLERRYCLFMDGPNFVEPIIMVFFTGDDGIDDPLDPPEGVWVSPLADEAFYQNDPTGYYIIGLVGIAPPISNPEGAILFFLDYTLRDQVDRRATMRLLGLPVVAAERLPGGSAELGAGFSTGYFWPSRPYFVLGMLDGDGDGRYEIGEDWLGYLREPDRIHLPFPTYPDSIHPGISFRIEAPGKLRPGSLR